jgi:hypothetical protein
MMMANGNSGGTLASPQPQEQPRGLSAPSRPPAASEPAKSNVAYLAKPDTSSSAPPAAAEPDIATMRSVRTSYASEADVRAAQIAAAEARADAKIARLENKIDTFAAILSEKLDSVGGKMETAHEPLRSADRSSHETRVLLLIGIAAAAAVLAIVALALSIFGDAMFARGMHVRDVVQTVLKEQQEQQPGKAPAQGGAQAGVQAPQGGAQAPAATAPPIQHVR